MAWSFQVSDATRCIELGFELSGQMPRVPGVPPFVVATGLAHDDFRLDDGSSGCSETVLIGSHAGTHVDGLTHVSQEGILNGGVAVADAQTRSGITHLDMTTVQPFVAPGILIDLPARLGVDVVQEPLELTPPVLEDLLPDELGSAVVLVRTGWGAMWRADPRRYASTTESRPGIGHEGAAWLAQRGAMGVGTDSFSIEVSPTVRAGHSTMPAHVQLLVRSGVYVFEAMDLEGLAATGAARFLFVALPLRLAGASGSPVRPIALI